MATPSNLSLTKQVVDFFETDDWPHQQTGETIVSTAFDGTHAQYLCFAYVLEAQEQIIFYSICPFKVLPEKQQAMTALINLANCGLVMGNFELLPADNELRFKTSLDVEGVEYNHQLLKNIIYPNVLTIDRYFPALMAVNTSNIAVEEALAQIEA
jgi:hypothetical protein